MRVERPGFSPLVLVAGLGALLAAAAGCKRSRQLPATADAGASASARPDLVCREQPDGCFYCAGRDLEPLPLEDDQSRPTVCNPKDEEDCIEFCSNVTADCALPWAAAPRCVAASDEEFQQALFLRQAADRPEVLFAGRVVDEAGHRIEGARVKTWVIRGASPTALADEATGKDGLFRLKLRAGPWSYALRVSHPGFASELVGRLVLDRIEKGGVPAAPRTFRLGPELSVRGRVADATTGAAVPGAGVRAFLAGEAALPAAEASTGEDGTFSLGGLSARRYVLDVTKFGWRPSRTRVPVTPPAPKVTLKIVHASVINLLVVDAAGEAEPSATVAAVLAAGAGAATVKFNWSTDGEGRYRQVATPGTYYLWARRGEMLAYPPVKLELADGQEAPELKLTLAHKGAHVTGRLALGDGVAKDLGTRVVLVGRSPLAYPKNAVAEVDRNQGFTITGVLPGRYELSVRSAATDRPMRIVSGPREVEVPVEPGTTVALEEPIQVRTQSED
jgi:hypothetical protein